MRTIASIITALAVAGGVLSFASSGSAAPAGSVHSQPVSDYVSTTGERYFYSDGQFQPTYPQSGPQASTTVKSYFYYDGQFQPSYESVGSDKAASSEPTGRFYVDGQFYETFS